MGFLCVSASVFASCAFSLFGFIPSTCLFYSILFFLFACFLKTKKVWSWTSGDLGRIWKEMNKEKL